MMVERIWIWSLSNKSKTLQRHVLKLATSWFIRSPSRKDDIQIGFLLKKKIYQRENVRMVGLLLQTLRTKLLSARVSLILLRIDTCPSKMQQQISKLTQVMLKHKVSHEVEAYKFLHMMAEVRWLLRPRASRRRWQKPNKRAKESKLLYKLLHLHLHPVFGFISSLSRMIGFEGE